MSNHKRPVAFWIFSVFLAISIVLMLLGQTLSIFNYDLAVRMGLQESLSEVGELGVQVNRAFGAGDTIVYIPLLIASLVGLWIRKGWSLVTIAAVAGVSIYWSVTVSCIMLFAPGTPGYNYVPGPDIWVIVGAFFVFGIWGFFYVIFRGESLMR